MTYVMSENANGLHVIYILLSNKHELAFRITRSYNFIPTFHFLPTKLYHILQSALSLSLVFHQFLYVQEDNFGLYVMFSCNLFLFWIYDISSDLSRIT